MQGLYNLHLFIEKLTAIWNTIRNKLPEIIIFVLFV